MVLLIDRGSQEEGLYVYNMYNLVEKHFLISIVPVRSRGESLLRYKKTELESISVIGIVYGKYKNGTNFHKETM
jgi:hypothetical protein